MSEKANIRQSLDELNKSLDFSLEQLTKITGPRLKEDENECVSIEGIVSDIQIKVNGAIRRAKQVGQLIDSLLEVL